LQVPVTSDFQWIGYSNAKSYHFQLSDSYDFQQVIEDIQDINSTNYKINNLLNDHIYYWRVRYTTSTFVTSNWSEIWEFRTESANILKAPIINSVEQIDFKIPINTSLSWNSVSQATSYLFSLSKNPGFYPRIMKVSWHQDTLILVNNLDYNTLYYWRVAGQNDNAVSPWSFTKQFVTELKPVESVTPETGNNKMNPSGLLSWESIYGADSYHIIVSDDNNFDNIIIEITVNDTLFQYNLEEEKSYSWKIKAVNSENESQWSEVFTFTIPKSTDVKDNDDFEISIYPNPANDIIELGFGSNLIEYISIIDCLGEQVYINNFNEKNMVQNTLSIDLSTFSAGIYFVVIRTHDLVSTEKIILIK